MSVTIALAGNPNCGKTTMFNALTGANQYVGNWPGVTVEKKEGKLKNQKDVTVTDLPGIYSLSPYTLEEVVSRDYLLKEKPDVIIDLVDATNIERNLYLATQLLEIGIPVVIALNMVDLLKKNNIHINVKGLSSALGCPIVETSALKGTGLKEVVDEAIKCANQHRVPSKQMEFPNPAEGFDAIFEVVDDEIIFRMDDIKPEIVKQARQELTEEDTRIRREDKREHKHRQLIESMNTRPFWHYCEVCGKKEFITAKEALDAGWDYPPHFGGFGLLGPRNCGNCSLKDTLFWKVHTELPLPIVINEQLTPEEKIIWQRIKAEPESLLEK